MGGGPDGSNVVLECVDVAGRGRNLKMVPGLRLKATTGRTTHEECFQRNLTTEQTHWTTNPQRNVTCSYTEMSNTLDRNKSVESVEIPGWGLWCLQLCMEHNPLWCVCWMINDVNHSTWSRLCLCGLNPYSCENDWFSQRVQINESQLWNMFFQVCQWHVKISAPALVGKQSD